MKKALFSTLIAILLFSTVACGEEPSNSSDVSTDSVSEISSQILAEEIPVEESDPSSSNTTADSWYADENSDAPVGSSTFLEEYRQLGLTKWGQLVNSVNAENIDSIDVLVEHKFERTRTSTFDPEVIRGWVDLFRSIQVPGKPSLGFDADDDEISITFRIYNHEKISYSTSFDLIQVNGCPEGISWVEGPGDYSVTIKEMDMNRLNNLLAQMESPVWRPLDTNSIKFLVERREEKFRSIDAKDVTKFEVISDEWSEEISKATTDAELIQKWVTWLHSIEICDDVDAGFENNGSTSYYYYDAQGQRRLLFTKSSQTIDMSVDEDPHGLQIKQWDSELYQQLWEAMGLPTAKS